MGSQRVHAHLRRLLLLGGRAGDLIGRKRVFLAGVVVFTTASFLNGIADSSTFLILARGLQGLGAALVAPAALSILTTTFAEGADRTKALGVWAAIATGGAAVGLLLGGILVEFLSWPWIFTVRTVRTANVTMLLVASGLFAMFFFDTLYAQQVLGFSPLQAGLAFLPVTAGIGIGAGLSQPGVRKLGIRTTSIIGMTLATVGMLLLLTTDANGTYLTDLLPGLIPVSIGMGLTFVPVTLLATSGVEPVDAGLASGLFNTSQQVGGALGLAILSTVAVNRTNGALGGLPGQPTAVQQGEALVTGFHGAFFGGALFFVAGIIVMVTLLKRDDVAEVDVDRSMTDLAA